MSDSNNENATATAQAMQASFKEAADSSIARATAGLEKSTAQMKEHMDKAMKRAEEFASFGQGTLEAMMQSSHIWTAGLQDLSKQFAATAQSQLTETMSTFKAMSGLRSLKDVMDAQASFARASVDKAMTESGKLTDASLKLAEQTMAPLTARVSLAVETFAKAA